MPCGKLRKDNHRMLLCNHYPTPAEQNHASLRSNPANRPAIRSAEQLGLNALAAAEKFKHMLFEHFLR